MQLSLTRSNRQGVYNVQARLLEVVDGKPKGIRHQVRLEYPNPSRAHLGDLLLAAVMQLDASQLPMFLGEGSRP